MLKKWVVCVLFLVIICFASIGFAGENIRILVNGKEVKSDTPAQIVNSRTMVPIRFVADAFGANVEWDGNNKVVIITTTQKNSIDNNVNQNQNNNQNSTLKLLKLNGEQTTWPYWIEDGKFYMEYKNAVDLIKLQHTGSVYNVQFYKDSSLLIINDYNLNIPSIKKGDFTAVSLSYLKDFRSAILDYDWDPKAENLTLIKRR